MSRGINGQYIKSTVDRKTMVLKAYKLGFTTTEIRVLTGLSRQRLHQIRKLNL